MRIAIYVRVSSLQQAQSQTIEQQLERLQMHCQAQQWAWQDAQIFRDEGVSRGNAASSRSGALA